MTQMAQYECFSQDLYSHREDICKNGTLSQLADAGIYAIEESVADDILDGLSYDGDYVQTDEAKDTIISAIYATFEEKYGEDFADCADNFIQDNDDIAGIAVSIDTMLKNGNQFSLDGGIPAWTVEGDDLAKVNDFLKKSCMEFCGSLPGDEKDEDGYSLSGEAKDATASRNGLSRNQMGIEEKAAECKEAATVLANGNAL